MGKLQRGDGESGALGPVEDVEGGAGDGEEEKQAEEHKGGPKAAEAEAAAAGASAVVVPRVERWIGAVRVAHRIVKMGFWRRKLGRIGGGSWVGGGSRGGGAIRLACWVNSVGHS